MTGLRLSDLMMPGSATPLARAMVAAPRPTDGPSPLTSLQLSRQDGTAVHAEALITDLTGDARVRGYVVNVRDVTERMQFEDRLSHQAFHDLTTGLANRALFCRRTVHALERHDQRDAPVAVLFLDLDDFKSMNDGLGFLGGDQLLAAVGARLSASTRAADTIARVGGDEFAILLEASPDGDAVATACRVHDLLEQPFVLDGREVFAHASIGIAFADAATSGEDGAEQLLRDADVAMYTAKEQGKAQWRIFETEMHQAVYDRLELKNDLERAIERGELEPALPADRAARHGRSERLRGPAALAAPDARQRAAARLHPARRGNRTDRPDRPARAARRLPRRRTPELRRRAAPDDPCRRQHLRAPAAAARADRRGAGRTRVLGPAARAARDRAHGERDDARHRPLDPSPGSS